MAIHDSLLIQLKAADPEQRKSAIVTLGRSGDKAALPLLAEVHRSDPMPELRELALKAGRYIQQQTMTMPALPTESAPTPQVEKRAIPILNDPNEVSVADRDRAKIYYQGALDYQLQGKSKIAARELAKALEIHPQLAEQTHIVNLAQKITGLAGEAALAAIQDKHQRQQVNQQSPTLKVAKESRRLNADQIASRSALVVLMVVLILMIYFFASSSLPQRYYDYFRVRQLMPQVEEVELADKTMRYFLYVPEGSPPPGGWGVMMLFHGYGGSGEDVIKPFLIAASEEKFILLAPTLGEYHATSQSFSLDRSNRSIEKTNDALNEVIAAYPVNEEAIVIYGFSRGGMFTTEYAQVYSNRIKGLVAEAPPHIYVPPYDGRLLIPYTIVFGEKDGNYTSNPQWSQAIEALEALGYTVRLEVVPNTGHSMTTQGGIAALDMLKAALAQSQN